MLLILHHRRANVTHQNTVIDLTGVDTGSPTNAQMVANVVNAINTTMANVPLDPNYYSKSWYNKQQ